MRLTARAPGKVNLCLFLGPVRDDGRHELVTLFESVSLADSIEMTPAPAAAAAAPAAAAPPAAASAPADQVVCAGVNGLNIVAQTLDGLRSRGWHGPHVRVVSSVADGPGAAVVAVLAGGQRQAAAVRSQ